MVEWIEMLIENVVTTVVQLESVTIYSEIQLSFRFANINQPTYNIRQYHRLNFVELCNLSRVGYSLLDGGFSIKFHCDCLLKKYQPTHIVRLCFYIKRNWPTSTWYGLQAICEYLY